MIETGYVPDFYDGNDIDTTFTFSWRILAKADLVVKVVTVATGAVVVLELDTDYTIDDEWVDNDAGGEIVTTDPVADGDRIWLIRDTTKTQLVNITEGSPFPAAVVTKVFDRLTMMIQELLRPELIGSEMPVTEGEDSISITFEEALTSTNYEIVGIAPNWLTSWNWENKLTTGFDIVFAVAAPADALVTWRVKVP